MAYRIHIDERWTLGDLADFGKNYQQVYFLTYSLQPDIPITRTEGSIEAVYRMYPWGGGFSTVNFYDHLRAAIPSEQRLQIKSIQYASPGYVEVAAWSVVALSVTQAIKLLASTVREVNAAYNEIYSDMKARKLLRLEVKEKELQLSASELELVTDYADRLSKALGFANYQKLNARTKNPYLTLKILLSYYRRLRVLAKLHLDGKLKL